MTLFGHLSHNFLNKIDKNVRNHGLDKGILKTFASYGIELSVYFENEKTKNILEKSGAIVVCNHPSFIDPFILLCSIPSRENISILLSSDFIGFSREIDKIAISVFARNKTRNNSFADKILEKLVFEKAIEYDNAHKINIKSIRKASKIVSQGSLIIVFPSPLIDLSKNKWKSGLGYLLKNVEDNQNKYYVEAFIKNTTILDIFRIVPFMNKLFPKIEIRFKEPKRISAIIGNNLNEKQIVEKLQNHYLNSLNTINF